jgi:hypothetical protein
VVVWEAFQLFQIASTVVVEEILGLPEPPVLVVAVELRQ